MQNRNYKLVNCIKVTLLLPALILTLTFSGTASAFSTYHGPFGPISDKILFGLGSWVSPPNHEQITRSALTSIIAPSNVHLQYGTPAQFSPQTIERIIEANVATDGAPTNVESLHFDHDAFADGQHNLIVARFAIANFARIGDYQTAQDIFGTALHGIQDFYAHSNYVELKQSVFAPLLPPLLPLGHKDMENIFPAASAITAGCTQNALLPNGDQLTSDWFSKRHQLFTSTEYNDMSTNTERVKGNHTNINDDYWPPNKCVHGTPTSNGLGINKDSDARVGFSIASKLASKATIQFANEILNDLKDDPKAICGLLGYSDSCSGTLPSSICKLTKLPSNDTVPFYIDKNYSANDAIFANADKFVLTCYTDLNSKTIDFTESFYKVRPNVLDDLYYGFDRTIPFTPGDLYSGSIIKYKQFIDGSNFGDTNVRSFGDMVTYRIAGDKSIVYLKKTSGVYNSRSDMPSTGGLYDPADRNAIYLSNSSLSSQLVCLSPLKYPNATSDYSRQVAQYDKNGNIAFYQPDFSLPTNGYPCVTLSQVQAINALDFKTYPLFKALAR